GRDQGGFGTTDVECSRAGVRGHWHGNVHRWTPYRAGLPARPRPTRARQPGRVLRRGRGILARGAGPRRPAASRTGDGGTGADSVRGRRIRVGAAAAAARGWPPAAGSAAHRGDDLWNRADHPVVALTRAPELVALSNGELGRRSADRH